MTNEQALDAMRQMFIIGVRLAGPVLIISMAVGVVISIIQAATQIHEQTITFVPKLFLICLLLLLFGSNMLVTIQEFTRMLFSRI